MNKEFIHTLNKFKLFVENILVYGLGGIISKIIPLIMVPIVTAIMPNTDYFGISDMSNTIIQFGSAVAIMGMYDAMYRLFFEKDDEEYKRKVCSTTFVFCCITSFLVFVVMLVFKNDIAKIFFDNEKYAYVVYISAIATLVGATNSIIAAPTRMQNKKKIFLITNTVSPLLSYSISIPLLLSGHYIIALPLAGVIAGFTLEVTFAMLNKKWFSRNAVDKSLLRPLLKIAIPLFPNFLIYWVFNSCDRVMITNLIGIGESGIYSVGAKLGQASQLIYTAFASGWQFFAFSTMKDENQVESNSRIFEYLGIISFVATSFICAWSYFIFKSLFKEDYLGGYIVAPYLFFAPLLQMLFQVAANQFLVVKKTWPNLFILLFGAISNILINIMLIPRLGIEGASMATLFGYLISDIICIMVLSHMKLMKISYKFFASSIIMIIYMILWRTHLSTYIVGGNLAALAFSSILIYLYRKDLYNFFIILKTRKGKK